MKKQRFYQISILIVTAILAIGCTQEKTPKPSVVSHKTTKVPSQKTTGITLSQLDGSGMDKLTLKSNRAEYKEKDTVLFSINTNNLEGYIYVLYLDSKGEVGILYPDENAPLTEMSGELVFPNDFGIDTLFASKDCKNCEKDKSVVYAFLSKKPILDIQNITKAQILQIGGEVKSKGFNKVNKTNHKNTNLVNVGKLEFIVK